MGERENLLPVYEECIGKETVPQAERHCMHYDSDNTHTHTRTHMYARTHTHTCVPAERRTALVQALSPNLPPSAAVTWQHEICSCWSIAGNIPNHGLNLYGGKTVALTSELHDHTILSQVKVLLYSRPITLLLPHKYYSFHERQLVNIMYFLPWLTLWMYLPPEAYKSPIINPIQLYSPSCSASVLCCQFDLSASMSSENYSFISLSCSLALLGLLKRFHLQGHIQNSKRFNSILDALNAHLKNNCWA